MWPTTAPVVPVTGESGPDGAALGLSVRPNPAGASVEVVVTAPEPAEAVMTVLDAMGREVARLYTGPLAAGATPFALHTSGWAADVYAVRATVGTHTETARLVVTR